MTRPKMLAMLTCHENVTAGRQIISRYLPFKSFKTNQKIHQHIDLEFSCAAPEKKPRKSAINVDEFSIRMTIALRAIRAIKSSGKNFKLRQGR